MSNALKPYTTYKDSGVEWLGEVPEGWRIGSLRRFVKSVETGGIPTSEVPEISEYGLNWFTPGDFINTPILNTSIKKLQQKNPDIKDIKLFPKNSVLLVGIGATLGKCGVSAEICSANQQINVIINNQEKCFSLYLYYFLLVNTQQINYLSNSSTIGILNQEKTKDIQLTIPSLPEQQAIADYLDTQTQRIDSLVQEQKELIELLKEKRQALISHCVTKGLDPHAKMKDSGVAWLGEVPEGWEVSKLKYTTYIKARIGWQNLRSEEFGTEGILCVTGTDFLDGKVNLLDAYRVSLERYDQDSNIQLRNNDLLITKDGSIGKIALVSNLNEKATLNSGIFLTRPKNSQYLQKYFYWYLKSYSFSEFITELSRGSTINHLYQNIFENFEILLPPIPEQQAIADYLDTETTKIDNLIQEAEETITLMQEHRSALISAVVTGKVKVPGVIEQQTGD